MAPPINSSPIKIIPNPTMISPTCLCFVLLLKKSNIAPTNIAKGANSFGFKNAAHSELDTIHDVTVVPILAPIITPTAWVKFISPALTNPTTITVVAELDWIIAVTAAPKVTAKKRFAVNNPNKSFILPPADFCNPSAIICMPKRNIPKPPRKANNANKISWINSVFILISYIRFILWLNYLYKNLTKS